MKHKLIFSLLLTSIMVVAQPLKDINPLNIFSGYNNFYMNNHEEGVVYLWHWDDNRTIMLSSGGLSDLVFPQEYYIHNTYSIGDIEVINVQDSLNTVFGRKEVMHKNHICVLFYNFPDTISIDSLSCRIRSRFRNDTK